MSKRSLSSFSPPTGKVIAFPITEGKRQGDILELAQTPSNIVVGRYEGNDEWFQVHNKTINPHCVTLWLQNKGKPGDILMGPIMFYDLMNKVKGRKTKYFRGAPSVKPVVL